MFSYVAKSLLSKTLRTFLRRYLDDIDIESIDYGSTPSAASGKPGSNSAPDSGSGWGVRLSNVKLREGTELTKLKGKRKRAIRKKKVKRNSGETISAVDDRTPIIRNSKKTITSEGREESFDLPLSPRVGDGAADGSEDMSDTSGIHKGNDINLSQPASASSLHEHIQTGDRSFSVDSENGYFSSNPATPIQSRHGICGVPSTICLNANSKNSVESRQKMALKKVPILFNADPPLLSKGQMFVDDGKEKARAELEISAAEVDAPPPHFEGGTVNPASTGVCDRHKPSKDRSHDDDNDVSDDDSFIEVEDDMELVVGSGGIIGTLHIRLVHKELHVTVEEAHLVIEAVPSKSISVEGISEKPDNHEATSPQPQKTNRGNQSTSSSIKDDLASSVDDESESTIGEKIKKKSKLARYLSMIPHLFLRDCRLSLILPEKTGGNESKMDSCDNCTVFELGLDFLSVTNGDESLDVLRIDNGNKSPEGAPTHRFRRSSSVPRLDSEGKCLGKLKNQGTKNNIFSRKRARTGKGPDGGLWLKIYPPLTRPHRVMHSNEPKWARQQFLDSSESFFLRVSGVDLHVKLLERKDEMMVDMKNAWGNEYYDDFTMDSMLFGVDYVDPISLTRHQIKNMRLASDELSDGASATDSNGIQSIPFASSFHRIAQRTHCSNCTNSHLALNDCFFCWNECLNKKQDTISSMNNQMPLPGFVFCLSIADPLEINADRMSLEAIGYMKSLFTSQKLPNDEEQGNCDQEADAENSEMDLSKGDESGSTVASTWVFDDKSFPPFMQPDTVYLSSLAVSTIIIRVEAMHQSIDTSLKFRFWQFMGQSIHLEQSKIDCDEQFLQDITFHVGSMQCKDFIGACEKNLFETGQQLDAVHVSKSEVHLPCTASRVIGVSSQYPTVIDQRLDKSYAVHGRLIRSHIPKEVAGDALVSTTNVGYVNLRIGVVYLDIGADLIGEISKTFTNARSIFSVGPKWAKKSNKPRNTLKWLFQVSTKGGTLCCRPRIKMKIPESEFRVRKGLEGLSFDTFLQALAVKYGAYTFEQSTPLSVIPLCSLPENLRMHVLLFLDDLAPLERVFGTKKKKMSLAESPFLRIHAVSKNMARLGASSAKERVNRQAEARRRTKVLSRLRSLDTDYLESLLALHDASHKK